MLPEIPAEELSAVLDDCIVHLLAGQQVAGPPVDAIGLAKALGISVAWDGDQPGRARIMRTSAGRARRREASILLRPEARPERRQWAVAHEIGEALAHRVFAELGIDPRAAPPASREQVACWLAARLLLPGPWFADDALQCGWDLAPLKDRYATASHELIARRMLDFSPLIVATIYDQGQVTFRQGNRHGSGPPLPVERACQREVHVRACYWQQAEGDYVIRGWPVHEAHWKREILRLELPDETVE